MNLLMLGVGDSGLENPASEPVRRHLEYAGRMGGHIDLIVDTPHRGSTDHGALTVHRTGAGRGRYLWAAYGIAREAARQRPPDLIVSQDPFATALVGFWLRRALRRPLLIQNHSCFLFNRYWIAERPLTFRALHLLARYLLPRADAWRVVNTAERKIYIDRLQLPADRVRVLPVPCDLEEFEQKRLSDAEAKARNRLSFPAGTPVILWAGRPVRFKRLPILFRAFSEIRRVFPRARLIVAGRKDLAQEDLGRAAGNAQLEESLVWMGELTHADLVGTYAAADVFLYPSIYEGFGRVMVEAGAAGLPVVATATAGARDIIRDRETGYLAPIEDAPALAARARELLADPERRATMGAAARKWIRDQFDPGRSYDAIVSQWREVAAMGLTGEL
jgi:glycosyltransferase involved in cell wall biosynthesis